jgi:hypothetical protein
MLKEMRLSGFKPSLEPGRHTITAVASGYQPMSGEVEVLANPPFTIQFLLDPLVPPPELQPEYVASLRREDSTVFLGFVVDDESGEPLGGVRVSSTPSGAVTLTLKSHNPALN